MQLLCEDNVSSGIILLRENCGGWFLTKFPQLFNKTWGVKGEIIEKK